MIAPPRRVLLTRCAWHRGYYGYTIIVGVASWRGFGMGLSDGICRRCARRVRASWLDDRRRGASGHGTHRRVHRRPGGLRGRDGRHERAA